MATIEFQEKKRWGDLSKVYTRKKHNKRLKNCDKGVVEATTSSATPVNEAVSTETITDITNNQEKDGFEKGDDSVPQQPLQLNLTAKDGDSTNQVEVEEVPKNLSSLNVVSDGLSNENQPQVGDGLSNENQSQEGDGLSNENQQEEGDNSMNKLQEVPNGNAVINPVVVRVNDRSLQRDFFSHTVPGKTIRLVVRRIARLSSSSNRSKPNLSVHVSTKAGTADITSLSILMDLSIYRPKGKKN